MSIEYAEDKELARTVGQMVQEQGEFCALRENNVIILSAMKVNMDDAGENKACKGMPVALKKIGGPERLFVKDHGHYILLFDYTTWNEATQPERERWIHHALKKIKAEKTDKGKLKLGTNQPDIVAYVDTARRYARQMDELQEVNQALAHGKKVANFVAGLDGEESEQPQKPAPKVKAKPAPLPEPKVEEEPQPEPETQTEQAEAQDAVPEPEEEAALVEEEIIPPPRRVKNTSRKP